MDRIESTGADSAYRSPNKVTVVAGARGPVRAKIGKVKTATNAAVCQ